MYDVIIIGSGPVDMLQRFFAAHSFGIENCQSFRENTNGLGAHGLEMWGVFLPRALWILL